MFTEPQVTNSEWSGEGCVLNEIESSKENVTCACDHNTAFAIMMDVSGVKVRWYLNVEPAVFYTFIESQHSLDLERVNRFYALLKEFMYFKNTCWNKKW